MLTIELFLLDVRSFVSDGGIESLLADCKNILGEFAKYVNQKVSAEFLSYPHLLPNCVYLPDWNHAIMNLIKRVLDGLPLWPHRLVRIRALCKMFRNYEYRSTLKQDLMDKLQWAMADKLTHFSASMAHWRYETVYTCFRALLHNREFCESWFDPKGLGECEEPATIEAAAAACNDKPFWRFSYSTATKWW